MLIKAVGAYSGSYFNVRFQNRPHSTSAAPSERSLTSSARLARANLGCKKNNQSARHQAEKTPEEATMSTDKLPPVTRRRFLKNAGLTVAIAGSAPVVSAPFISRAIAQTKSLSIVQWSHFVPEYDKWFDNFAKDWG